MSDSIIQFKYSDDVHMVAIYIKQGTEQDLFIPYLYKVVDSCENTSEQCNWGYVVAEIISKITQDSEGMVGVILESHIEPSIVMYKYVVTIYEDLYKNKNNRLIDHCYIKTIDNKPEHFDGLLKDFKNKVTLNSNIQRIPMLEEDIKRLQEEIRLLK